jgi:hypothetical protein
MITIGGSVNHSLLIMTGIISLLFSISLVVRAERIFINISVSVNLIGYVVLTH